MKKIQTYLHCGQRDSDLQNDAGFSILETIIAMAILALAYLPILQLQSQMTKSVIAAESFTERLQIKKEAFFVLDMQNFYLDTTGAKDIGYGRLEWVGIPLTKDTQIYQNQFEYGRFKILLYQINAKITYQNKEAEDLKVIGLGWYPLQPLGKL